MISNSDLQARKDAATPRGVSVLSDFFAARAENAELWDVEGRRYIDFASGIAVNNVGHRHPRVVAAVREQLDHVMHTSYQVVPYAGYVELAEKINARAPGEFRKKTAFFTTGAEAVENAVKIARLATGRSGVIAFGGAFHGRTLMGMALTGKVASYKTGFGAMPPEVFHAPFPSALQGIATTDALRGLEHIFRSDIDPQRVAAIIFEPVQGEGGFHPAPTDFVLELRRICDAHRILLIADEIQTGFGRTGKLFAMEHHGVAADIMTFAKSLAGGMPLSGVTGRAEVMDAAPPGGLGGTYAGNPLAIAAAHAVLDVIDNERLVERSALLGLQLRDRLARIAAVVPELREVRGAGSMIAAEFCKPGSNEPDTEFAKGVIARARELGLILLSCGAYGNAIRFLYPLTIPQPVFDEALDILAAALGAQPAPAGRAASPAPAIA